MASATTSFQRPGAIFNAAKEQRSQAPLALSLLEHPDKIQFQSKCPLFTTLLPEIREIIWQYALQQDEDDEPMDIQQRWVRPGLLKKLKIPIELLVTCRAIYFEAFMFPAASNAVHVFDGEFRDRPRNVPLHVPVYGIYNLLKMSPWQFAAVTEVDLTLRQKELEGGALERCSRNMGVLARHKGCRFEHAVTGEYPSYKLEADLSGSAARRPKMLLPTSSVSLDQLRIGLPITHLTLRLNRTDWWTWTDHPDAAGLGKKLRLEPMVNYTCPPHNDDAMEKGRESRRSGREPEFKLDAFEASGRWGPQLREFWPDLKSLTIVMETFAAKESQLNSIVKAAKLWKFAMPNNAVLACTGNATTIHWQGASRYGYENVVPWLYEDSVSLPDAIKKSAQYFWRGVTGKQQDENGQTFVVKSLTYTRQRA